MKKFSRPIMALLFFSFVPLHLIAKSWPVPFHQSSLALGQGAEAVILGAGPAGLLAAQIALKSGHFQRIIIIEKRSEFSRFNMVNFFPENWPMLNKIGVAEDFRAIGQSTDIFSLHIDHFGNDLINFEIGSEPAPENFDYRGPVLEIFEQHKAGLFILNLADLQYQLAKSLSQQANVFFVHGSANFANDEHTQKHGIAITTFDGISHHLEPDLIVVAEGAHSESRVQLGIKLVPRMAQQWWCSGSISLKNIWENGPKIMQVLDKKEENSSSLRTFGIFNLRPSELFLNGQASSSEENVDDCLIRNAITLIGFRAMKGDRGINPDLSSLSVKKKSQGIIDITPSRAEYFSSKNNVILFGDAAGFATPKGGIGFSLLTGVYPQALLDLLENWPDESIRREILQRYENRVGEIVDFWHIKTGLALKTK